MWNKIYCVDKVHNAGWIKPENGSPCRINRFCKIKLKLNPINEN